MIMMLRMYDGLKRATKGNLYLLVYKLIYSGDLKRWSFKLSICEGIHERSG